MRTERNGPGRGSDGQSREGSTTRLPAQEAAAEGAKGMQVGRRAHKDPEISDIPSDAHGRIIRHHELFLPGQLLVLRCVSESALAWDDGEQPSVRP